MVKIRSCGKCPACGKGRSIEELPTVGRVACVQTKWFEDICSECEKWMDETQAKIDAGEL
jgi:hypothetical protein